MEEREEFMESYGLLYNNGGGLHWIDSAFGPPSRLTLHLSNVKTKDSPGHAKHVPLPPPDSVNMYC